MSILKYILFICLSESLSASNMDMLLSHKVKQPLKTGKDYTNKKTVSSPISRY